jgi:MoaA/NifB/PqqE/SkfB family radical SAM enzyme
MCDIGVSNIESHFTLNMKKGNNEIPIAKFKKFIDSVKRFGPEISIGSTEPLLYRDILSAVGYVKECGLKCSVGTNGFLLPRFAESLVRLGLDELQVSIDGPEEIHDKIRGVPHAYKNAVDGIVAVNRYKKKLGKDLPKICINTTISEFNFDSLKKTADLALNGFGADNITVTHLNFVSKDMARRQNKGWPNYYVTESCLSVLDLEKIDLDVLFSQLEKIKKDFSYGHVQVIPDMSREELDIYYFKHSQPIAGHDRCFVPWLNSQISSNGDVIVLTRCFHYVLGNIYKSSFNKIWNGKRARDLRKDLLKSKCFPACTRCCGIY